jgi:hypothetical protein
MEGTKAVTAIQLTKPGTMRFEKRWSSTSIAEKRRPFEFKIIIDEN